MNTNTIGVDISKDHLDAHRLATGDHALFDDTALGLKKFERWLGPEHPDLVVFEPTGPCHRDFEAAFRGRLPLVKVNPLQARRFAQAHGTRAKTDAVDARMLALMGRALDLVPDRPMDEIQIVLRDLRVARAGLVRDRTALMNRLAVARLPILRRLAKARLAQAERQIAALDAEIDTCLEACPQRRRAMQILTSIPGIGRVTARSILAECPEIGSLRHKQMAALAGLAPMTRQSGAWRGKARIQGGRRHLREALFMPALVAMKKNPDLSEKYTAMREAGKPHKVAITTLMRKLIQLANTLIKDDRIWQPKPA